MRLNKLSYLYRGVLNVTIFVSVFVILTTCKELFEPELPNNYIDTLIVEGDITVGDLSSIYLSKAVLLSQGVDEIEYITDAIVYIEDENSVIYASSRKNDREEVPYFEIDSRELQTDKKYKLVVKYENNEYSTELLTVMQTPEIKEIGYDINNERQSVSFHVTTEGNENAPRYYKWSYKEDWEFTAKYYTVAYYDVDIDETVFMETPNRYYCWDRADSHDIHIATTQNLQANLINEHIFKSVHFTNNRLSYLYRVELFQRSITQTEYKYLSNVKKNSDEIGGIFGPQPSEMQGNIKCTTDNTKTVQGFISCSTLSKMTRYFETHKLGVFISDDCKLIQNIVYEGGIYTNREMVWAGYQLYLKEIGSPWMWTRKNCVDCRVTSSKSKPSDWPVTHE